MKLANVQTVIETNHPNGWVTITMEMLVHQDRKGELQK